MEGSLLAKYEELKAYLRGLESFVVAYSGGVDSTLLLKASKDAGVYFFALYVDSPLQKMSTRLVAARAAEDLGVELKILDMDTTEIEGMKKNPPDRCYHCKKHIFTEIIAYARQYDITMVCEGTVKDDEQKYRPGKAAIAELGIKSPLADCGIDKETVRAMLRELGVEGWDRVSDSCLATRLPYGETLTGDKLHMIEITEDLLAKKGYRSFRVRYHWPVARIELLPEDRKRFIENDDPEIPKVFKDAGFKYISLDIEGYRSGSPEEMINI